MARKNLGRQAVVIGAGIGGLTAAGALAGFFDRVILLERDQLPPGAAFRPGVAQGRQLHGMLRGGVEALCALFPGFDKEVIKAGGVPTRLGLSMREEFAGKAKPQRDLGYDNFMVSRPLLEYLLRTALERHKNVTISSNCRVVELVATPDGGRVTAVKYAAGGGSATGTVPADFVVDASGRGAPTLSLLDILNRPHPREVKVGVDINYSTAWFRAKPKDPSRNWLGVYTHSNPPHSSRGGLLISAENDRWVVAMGSRTAEQPPAATLAQFLDYARQLQTQTIYDAIKDAEPLEEVARFSLPESVRRDYDAATMPDRLIVLGDALCRFNPIYGQGMSVAAREAVLIRSLLEARRNEAAPLDGVGQKFLAEAQVLIEGPWQMSVIPDFLYPETRGERPADFDKTIASLRAMRRLAMRDPAVDKLMVEVFHLVKPRSALQDPELVKRIDAEMAAMAEA